MVRALESSTNTDFPKLGPAKSRIVDNSEVSSAFIIRESLCHRLRIFAFYLTPGHHLNLRLPLVQFDCASDADHVALERDGPAVARQFRACRDVARESLIRVLPAEVQELFPFLLVYTATTSPRTFLPTYWAASESWTVGRSRALTRKTREIKKNTVRARTVLITGLYQNTDANSKGTKLPTD